MACNIGLPQVHDNVMVTDAVSRPRAGLGLPYLTLSDYTTRSAFTSLMRSST